jgi:hypothetical protein
MAAGWHWSNKIEENNRKPAPGRGPRGGAEVAKWGLRHSHSFGFPDFFTGENRVTGFQSAEYRDLQGITGNFREKITVLSNIRGLAFRAGNFQPKQGIFLPRGDRLTQGVISMLRFSKSHGLAHSFKSAEHAASLFCMHETGATLSDQCPHVAGAAVPASAAAQSPLRRVSDVHWVSAKRLTLFAMGHETTEAE